MARAGGGTENSPTGKAAKIALRRTALAWIGCDQAHVFEAFAGNGAMWRAVWREAKVSVGCDKRAIWDASRVLYAADVDRVLRSIDLGQFNIFDLDAFGSPWPVAYVLSARRKVKPGEKLAIVFTDGGRRKAYTGGFERVMAELAGTDPKTKAAHGAQVWDALTRQAMAGVAGRLGARIAWAQVDGGHGVNGGMTYSACGLVGAG